ncbi:MAG: SusC/RagA family TonB-linked outer membrane protein, partial [Hymenobacter sp.]
SYLDQDGIIIGTNLRRATLRANLNANIRKGVRFTMTLAPSMEWNSLGGVDGTGGQALNASQMPPVAPLDAGIYVGAQPYRTYQWAGNYISPIAVLERRQVSGERTRLNANMGLNLDLYKGLQLQLLGGMDNGYYNDQQYYPTNADRLWYSAAYEGQLSRSRLYQTYTQHYLFQSVLNYVKTYKGVHNLNAIAGYSVERNNQSDTQQENNTLPNDWSYLFDRANSTVGTSRILETTPAVLLSYFGRVQYDYKQKYLVSASLRRDGSSRFGNRRPFGYFPAVSVGWRVSDEPFMRDIKFISDLKLRASYGVTGNNRIPANSQYAILGVQNYSLNGTAVTGYSPSTIDNPDLRWERTGSFDVGFDFYLFNSRLGITFDAYDKKTTDLLYTAPVSAVTGFTNSFQNIGDLRNQGLELGLNSVNLTGKVQWTSSFNISYNRNKILRLGFDDTPVPGGFNNLTSVLQVGQPLGAYILYDAIGVYQTQAEVDAGPRMSGTRVGDTKYRDVNGDGVITNDDRTIVGKPQPDFIYGLTNTVRYGNFDLSVLINAQTGGQL